MHLSTMRETSELLGQYGTAKNLSARQRLHELYSTGTPPWLSWVLDHLLEAVPARAEVLEIGAGNGVLWSTGGARMPKAWSLTLTDLSDGMLAEARRNLAVAGVAASFQVADAHELAFPDAAFDAVIANHMLYHVKDRERALREVRRVLRPGGAFFAATNGRRHLEEFREPELLGILYPDGAPSALESDPSSFRLEDGGAELNEVFGEVATRIYVDRADALHVTAVEDLIDYHTSYVELGAPGREQVRQYYGRRAAPDGSITVRKSVGMFVCR